jgi:hypothetical protein
MLTLALHSRAYDTLLITRLIRPRYGWSQQTGGAHSIQTLFLSSRERSTLIHRGVPAQTPCTHLGLTYEQP